MQDVSATVPTPGPAADPTPMRRDWLTLIGAAGVGIAAGLMSFSALHGLGLLCGFGRLSMLVPVSVDLYALVATRAWLTSAAPEVRSYARWNALVGIGLSIAGNAIFHTLAVAGHGHPRPAPVGLVIVVSALPPVMLGLVGHLAMLTAARHPTPAASRAAVEPVPAAQMSAPEPSRPAPTAGERTTRRPAARPSGPSRPRTAAAAGSKRAQLLEALLERQRAAQAAGETLPGTAELARELAEPIGLHPGTARRHLAAALRENPQPRPAAAAPGLRVVGEPRRAIEPSRPSEPAGEVSPQREPAGR